MAKEQRHLISTELRVAGDGSSGVILGYAARFNMESNDLGGFREVIAPGAFARTLRERDPEDEMYDDDPDNDVKCLRDHNGSILLGRTANKSLQLSCDNEGLRFRCQLNMDIQSHREVHEAVRTGLMSTCSFAFQVAPNGQHWQDRTNGKETYSLRTLTDVDLFDVSCLGVAPAYPGTCVDARAILAQRGNAYTPAEIAAIKLRADAAIAQRKMRPYTPEEIKALRVSLEKKMNEKIARAENSLFDDGDDDDDVDDVDADDDDKRAKRLIACVTYSAEAVRSARIKKVLDQFKHDATVKWLRGEGK